MLPSIGFYRRAPIALFAAIVTATTAGAATLHRFSVSQTTGSGGAQTFLQSSPSSSALQGEVGGSSANSNIRIPFGVLGEYDPSGSAFGMGVAGISTTGYGVGGESLGSQPSVLGYSGGTGVGVEGVTPSSSIAVGVEGITNGDGSGVEGTSNAYGIGGEFHSNNWYGLYATSGVGGVGFLGSPTGDGVIAQGRTSTLESGGYAFLGVPTGEGVQSFGSSGTAADPTFATFDTIGGSDLIGAYGCGSSTAYDCGNPESFIVQAGSANRSGNAPLYAGASDVQVSGDLYVFGKVYENCNAFPATASTDCNDTSYAVGSGTSSVTRSAGGYDVKMYEPAQSVRTVEDFGQAQLVNGRAYVDLDPAFARTIAPSAPYLVFVTPSGDSHSLYATKRTLVGFEVHESEGGRSTMTIDYRIVAKPLGDTSRRFVAVAPKHHIPGYNMRKHVSPSKLIASLLRRQSAPIPRPIVPR